MFKIFKLFLNYLCITLLTTMCKLYNNLLFHYIAKNYKKNLWLIWRFYTIYNLITIFLKSYNAYFCSYDKKG